MINGCLNVYSGSSCSLYKVERARQVVFSEHYAVKVKNQILKLERVLGDDSLNSMIDLIKERIIRNEFCKAEARDSRFQKPSSVHISTYLKYKFEIHMENNNHRLINKIK